MDSAVIVGIATSFGGIAFGAYLNHRISRGAVASERAWAEEQEVRRRQMDAAAKLDEEVMDALEGALSGGDRREAADRLDAARGRLLRAWQRSTVLDDPEIEKRMNALDMSMVVAANHGRGSRRGDVDDSLNTWPISVASRELRVALACFQRGETPPEAEYPRASEVISLAHPDGRSIGLDGVNEYLLERNVTG